MENLLDFAMIEMCERLAKSGVRLAELEDLVDWEDYRKPGKLEGEQQRASTIIKYSPGH